MKKYITLAIVLVLLALPVSAELTEQAMKFSDKPEEEDSSKVSLLFTLRDFRTKNTTADQLVFIETYNTKTKEKKNYYDHTDEGGVLNFAISEGEWKITLMIDDLETPGKDYYVEYSDDIYEDVEKNLFIFPVGSLSGSVVDKLDNVVGGADLQFDCVSDYGSKCPVKSDDFGSFKNEFVPLGSCKVFASYEGAMGMQEITIEHGKVAEVNIKLDTTVVKITDLGSDYTVLNIIIPIAVVLFILVVIYLLRKQRPKKDKTNKEAVEDKPKTDKRMNDIISTLRKDEKTIVELLLNNQSKMTQAKVYHETGMPKTTLHRQVQSLENKNIISVEKIGKMKKLALTDWFLGKEQK